MKGGTKNWGAVAVVALVALIVTAVLRRPKCVAP